MVEYQSTPDFYNDYISHHGRLNQKWGVRNGPPYPLDRETVGKAYGKGSSGLFKKKNDIPKIEGIKVKTRNYSKEKDVKAVNPNYKNDPGYQTNCVYCSMTYDMRQRGYDVTANPRSPESLKVENGGNDFDTLKRCYYIPRNDLSWYTHVNNNQNAKKSWKYSKDEYNRPSQEDVQNLIRNIEWHFKSFPDNSRGMMGLNFWFDPNSGGHMVSWEKTNNKISIIDSQVGEISDLSSYDLIKEGYVCSIEAYRLDNLKIKPKNVKEFCR